MDVTSTLLWIMLVIALFQMLKSSPRWWSLIVILCSAALLISSESAADEVQLCGLYENRWGTQREYCSKQLPLEQKKREWVTEGSVIYYWKGELKHIYLKVRGENNHEFHKQNN